MEGDRPAQTILEYSTDESFRNIILRFNSKNPQQIYRSFQYGSMLDIFMLDERSYRGSNSENRQTEASDETAFLAKTQIDWLKKQLLTSRATWKVIASDMPFGLIVPDGSTAYEALANGDNDRPLGRELEFADLFQFIQRRNIRNVVWLIDDVHYAKAHYYAPSQAQFTDFHPFWEFVAGLLNAGTFGSNDLDNTFDPQVMFNSLPPDTKPNRPPTDGLQFFGMVKIDSDSEVITVSLHDLAGEVIYSIDLHPDSV